MKILYDVLSFDYKRKIATYATKEKAIKLIDEHQDLELKLYKRKQFLQNGYYTN